MGEIPQRITRAADPFLQQNQQAVDFFRQRLYFLGQIVNAGVEAVALAKSEFTQLLLQWLTLCCPSRLAQAQPCMRFAVLPSPECFTARSGPCHLLAIC